MTQNEIKANVIANHLGIKNGIIVNSGTIAILSALKIANIKFGDNVLINGYCCYSLFEAIMNAGANPIFVVPKDFYNISLDEIRKVIEENDIKCYIAAHQYGIVQDIKTIKEEFPNLIIIEDIAQGWNIQENELGIGNYSDYVVTSFGSSKALSYGQAGAIFSNYNIRQYFDFHDKNSRNSSSYLLPYVLYDCDNIDTENLVNNANYVVDKQRIIAMFLSQYFSNDNRFTIYKDKTLQNSSWHKFPVIINNKNDKNEFEQIMIDNGILFQWQNYKEVWELDMIKNYSPKIIKFGEKPTYALIMTNQNNIENVKTLVRSRKR